MPSKQHYKDELFEELNNNRESVDRDTAKVQKAYEELSKKFDPNDPDWKKSFKAAKEKAEQELRFHKDSLLMMHGDNFDVKGDARYKELNEKVEQYALYARGRNLYGKNIFDRSDEKVAQASQKYAKALKEYNGLGKWQKRFASILPAWLYKPSDLQNKVEGYRELLREAGADVQRIDDAPDPEKMAEEDLTRVKGIVDPELAKKKLPPKMEKVYDSVKGVFDIFSKNWENDLNKIVENQRMVVRDEYNALANFKEVQRNAFREEQAALKDKIEKYDQMPATEKKNLPQMAKDEHLEDVKNLNDVTFFLDNSRGIYPIPTGNYRFVDLHPSRMKAEDIAMLRKYNLAGKFLDELEKLEDLRNFRDNYAATLLEPVEPDVQPDKEDGPVFNEESADKTFNETPAAGKVEMIGDNNPSVGENVKEK